MNHPKRRIVATIAGLGLVFGAQVTLGPSPAAAATSLFVSTTADIATNAGACGNTGITTPPSPLSLREATCLANNIGGTATISLPSGTYLLTHGELQVGVHSGQNVTLDGTGAAATTISAGGASRVLDFDPDVVGGVGGTVSDLTITGGADNLYGGAGIIAGSNYKSSADTLTINNSVITANHANAAAPNVTSNPGGGVQFVGGTLTISNSTISNNSSLSSPGSGVAYAGRGATAGEALTVTNTTFSGNSATNSNGTSVTNGGALDIRGLPSTPAVITGSRFANNSVVATTGGAVGAAIRHENGALTVTGSTFTGNAVSGGAATPAGGAIEVTTGTATLHFNRFLGNAATSGSAIHVGSGAGSVDATENWFGCNAAPGASGCDSVSGSLAVSPRLALTITPNPLTVFGPGATSAITASLTTDSVGAPVAPANLGAFHGLVVGWSDPQPNGATVNGSTATATTTISSGQSLVTYGSQDASGVGHVVASLDNGSLTGAVIVDRAPTVTLNPTNQAVHPGDPVSFTAAGTGFPVPTVKWQRSVDGGNSFTDIPGATSTTYSFTAAAADSGNQYRALFTNSTDISRTATSTAATLTVQHPPSFTSPTTATFVAGTAGIFTITTSGQPTVSTITMSGSLPSGLTFTDNGNGTATVAGTPAANAGGTYPVGLTAVNGVAPAGTQSLAVQVNQAPAVIANPSDQLVNPGTPVSFTAAATGVPTPTVQWQRSTDGGSSYTNIVGATTATYSFTATAADGGNRYRAVFTNIVSSATSTGALLLVGSAPAFTSGNVATFAVGAAGSFAITTSGVPSATLSSAGTVPAWLIVTDNGDGTGTLTGTPPAGSGGAYTFTLEAANGFNPAASQTFTLSVDESPTITSADHVTFTVGSAGTFAVTTTAGFPTATAITASGVLPGGVTLVDNHDGTATLSGTPSAGTSGSYPIVVSAAAVGGITAGTTQSFTLTVHGPPTITSADHATFAVGSNGTFTVQTTPGNPSVTTLSAIGTLPSGVTFMDNGDGSATLSGTPAAGTGKSYPVTIHAQNSALSSTQAFTLTVTDLPTFASANNTTVTVGTSATFPISTVPGFPAATAMTETGALPGGLIFTDLGGGSATLSGMPAAGTGGSYALTLTATNSVGHTDQSFILTVHESPAITSGDHTMFTVGSAGSFTVTTGGGFPVPPLLTETGALPGGVTFTDNKDGTATLAGTPAAATGGVYSVAIKASNGVDPGATQTFTLTVDQAPSVVSDDHTTFGSGVTGTFTVATAGFPTPVVSETGTLPDGVTFVDNHDGTATMQGMPAAGTAGAYPITITAANGVGSDATQSFTLTVTTAPQTIAFTSTPPAPGVVGQTYVVAATGGASGNPVVFSIDAGSSGVCSINGSTVHLNHPGSCLIDADQAGNAQYSAGSASQSASVTKSATSTAVAVHARTITATVTAVAPGAGTPTGSVAFAVKGKPVGTAVLSGGVATLTYHVPTGKTRQVSAVYSGDSDFTASSGSTARHDPSIAAMVSSSHAKTKYGWYRSWVTIKFHCATHGAALTSACPSPVTLSRNGAGQSVARTVTAVDGGAATVTVRGINIDMTLPAVRITGVRSGASYPGGAPAARCVGSDSVSGIASCTLSKSTRGDSVTITARATDRAGNIRSATVAYHLLPFYVLGASYQNGAFVLHEGHRYTVVALTTSKSRPRFYDAAPWGRTPGPADNLLNAAGSQFGLHRYTLSVYFGRGMGRYTYWNFGVKVGSTMHLVKFHPVR